MSNMNDYYNGIASGYNQLYQEEQLKKLTFIINQIPKEFLKNITNVLDVGCGTGVSSDFFAKQEFEVTGIDPAIKLINQNENEISKLIEASAENIPFKDNSFDLVISFTAIQNFYDLEKGLSEIKRVGKGKFILTFLKGVKKSNIISNTIKETFPKAKELEDDKDKFYIIDNYLK